MIKNYKAVESTTLSQKYEKRYVIIDTETGELLDDAQGYGYKTAQKAYACFGYKNRDKSKDKEKAQKMTIVRNWCKKNKGFISLLEDDEFRIAKGSYGPEDEFNTKWIKERLKEYTQEKLEFTANDLYKYIAKYGY